MNLVKEKFFQLSGSWQLERFISDYGVATGKATLNLIAPDKIHYIENIEVYPNNQQIWLAKREYFYQFASNKNNYKIRASCKKIFLFAS